MPKIRPGGRAGKLNAGTLCEAISIHLRATRGSKAFNRLMGAAGRACRRRRYEEMVHYLMRAGWIEQDRAIPRVSSRRGK